MKVWKKWRFLALLFFFICRTYCSIRFWNPDPLFRIRFHSFLMRIHTLTATVIPESKKNNSDFLNFCKIWDMIQIRIRVSIGIKLQSWIWIESTSKRTMRSTTVLETPNFVILFLFRSLFNSPELGSSIVYESGSSTVFPKNTLTQIKRTNPFYAKRLFTEDICDWFRRNPRILPESLWLTWWESPWSFSPALIGEQSKP